MANLWGLSSGGPRRCQSHRSPVAREGGPGLALIASACERVVVSSGRACSLGPPPLRLAVAQDRLILG
jgi:hypothetical protein